MNRKVYFGILLLLILLIAITHNIATEHYLYWKYLWSDLVVHFFSGLWIALVGLGIFVFSKKEKAGIKTIILSTIVLSLSLGILWEVFEYSVGIISFSKWYVPDTISDIIMDMIGGIVGFFIALGLRKEPEEIVN